MESTSLVGTVLKVLPRRTGVSEGGKSGRASTSGWGVTTTVRMTLKYGMKTISPRSREKQYAVLASM
jgi:hypothetical protein